MSIRNLSKITFAFTLFTLLSGFRGCHVSSEVVGPPVYAPSGTIVVDTGPAVVFTGDLALTVYAPGSSAITTTTDAFNVTVREGGAFGPIILRGFDYRFDSFGVGVIDIGDLPYGFYDIEVVGLDMFGNSVSYSAQGMTIDEPFSVLTLDLEPVMFSGDVVMNLIEPDSGLFTGPIDTIDYVLYEKDPITGALTFVEEFIELDFNPWSAPVIGALGLGDYYIEVLAFDTWGYAIYEFAGSFNHDAETTFLPVTLWYY